MTLQDLGDLGDLIGGIAVVITLIYLAAQIRQNTALITAQTVQASVDATQRVLLQRVDNAPLRAVLRKARNNEDLRADDAEVLASYLQASFMNFQARLQHHARGVFDRSINESYELILGGLSESGYVRRWWHYAKPLFGRSFAIIAIDRRALPGDAPPVADWNAFVRFKDPELATKAPGDAATLTLTRRRLSLHASEWADAANYLNADDDRCTQSR